MSENNLSKINKNDLELLGQMYWSPLLFIKVMWGLDPQPLKCEKDHRHNVTCYEEFIKGRHVTWQQTQILEAIEKSLREGSPSFPRRISVRSGHGIGKDGCLAWLIHWFLFTRRNSQIGCTAPTSSQLYDVLWKEIAVWQRRLPEEVGSLFEWNTTHFKVKEAPEIWWARARTAAKEMPEAFAGMHGDSVMLIGDEASGIPDEIFRVGEGSLTNKDTLVILMGNPVRTDGFFYRTWADSEEAKNWQHFHFSSEESPIVEKDFVRRIESKYGRASDEFRFMVAGEPPLIRGVLKGGWMPLLAESDLKFCRDEGGWRLAQLGIDPSGEGSNYSSYVLRDRFKAKVVAKESISNPLDGANLGVTLANHYGVPLNQVTIDNFGEGANWAQEFALATGQRVQAINVGAKPDDQDRFLNKRSENYWRLREWLLAGGQLVGRLEDWKQLLTIYYRRNLYGKIQIMTKDDMSKNGWESPDDADALSLTFTSKDRPIAKGAMPSNDEPSESELINLAKIY